MLDNLNSIPQSDKKQELAKDWAEGGKTGLISVKGGSVYYRFYGAEQTNTPLIFIHGGPGHSMATFFRTTNLGKNRPVVYYNQLGSNGSDIGEEYRTKDKATELFTIERYVDELEQVIAHFGFKEYVLVGHSWGSMLAVEYAAAKQDPRLKGLVLVGPFLNVDLWLLDAKRLIHSLPDGARKYQIVQENETSGNYTKEYDEINALYSKEFFNRIEGDDAINPSEPQKLMVKGFDVYNYMWGPTEFSCTGKLQGHDATKLLSEINVPIQYISGEFDSGSPAAAAYYNALTPNGNVAVIEGTGHESPREKPEQFNRIVEKFLTDLS
ncbi:MAG: proline iminopeptidase-family hydrolase [Clostridiaceae bacterium]|nr:proline iminopeptidase-family hydrolase [Clostridiaceae bacterium]